VIEESAGDDRFQACKNPSGKKSVYSTGFAGEAEIGRANLPVSRIIIFSFFDGENGLFAEVYQRGSPGGSPF
jgi:hypothetical protein